MSSNWDKCPPGPATFRRSIETEPKWRKADMPKCFRGCPCICPLERYVRYDNFYNGYNRGWRVCDICCPPLKMNNWQYQ